jgi:hypothetical protein
MRATQLGFVSSINKGRHHPRMRVIQFRFWDEKWVARMKRTMTSDFESEEDITWVARIRGP